MDSLSICPSVRFLDLQPSISSNLGEDDDKRPLDEDLLMTRHGVVGLGGSVPPSPLIKRGVIVQGGQTWSSFRDPAMTSVPET